MQSLIFLLYHWVTWYSRSKVFTWITGDYNQILLLIAIFLSVQWNGVSKDEIRDRERQTHRRQKLLCYNKHSPKQYMHQHTQRHHTNTRPFSVRISALLEDLFPEVNCNERGCFYPIQRPAFLQKVLAFSRTNQTSAQEILKIWLENHYIYSIGLCLGQQVFLFLLEVSKFLWHLILLKIKYRTKIP